MNKLFTFLASAALISLSACSSDEPAKGVDNNTQPNGDGAAYLSIRILSAESAGRTVTEGDYQDSDDKIWAEGYTNEHKVRHAKFFFFDEKGAFVLEAKTLDPTTGDIPFDADTKLDYVEYINTNNVLVLDKLTESDTYPTYMLTVLNAPSFEEGGTLTETLGKLQTYYANLDNSSVDGAEKTKSNYFVMSTSSYKGEDDHHADKIEKGAVPTYFATKINTTDYKTSADDAKKASPVDVYVERLAAKVEVLISAPKSNEEGKQNWYKLTQTVAGQENTGNDELSSTLYLEVEGWDLSATANNSYMFKNLDLDWTGTTLWSENWNKTSDHRSFWAKSWVYSDTNNDNLTYVTNENAPVCSVGTGNKGNYAYCNENTKPAFKTNNSDINATHVILRGIIRNGNGAAVNMVRGNNGVLYTQDAYVLNVLRRIDDAQNNLNLYTRTSKETTTEGEDGYNYDQIGAQYFELKPIEGSTRVGACKVYAKSEEIKALELYKYVDEIPEGSNSHYVKLSDEEKATAVANLESQLKASGVQPDDKDSAIIYDGGRTAYYIPIEHLGATADAAVKEGYYGVVRNHWYQLDINKLEGVGNGYWDPDNKTETLKPNEPNDKLYYLGARINILSWKIVKQSVNL